MKDKTFKEIIKNDAELDAYLRDCGIKHRYYRSYGKFPRLKDNLYTKHSLFLSDGTGWNDKKDVDRFRNQCGQNKLFGHCFSYSMDESVAMWMLYGGLEDKGGMFYLTQGQIKKILESHCSIRIGKFNKKNEFKEKKTIQYPYKMYVKDVLYFNAVNDKLWRVYRDNDAGTTDKSIAVKGAKHTFKHAGWSYEKETRLIVEIPWSEDIMDCTHIRIDLDEALGKNWLKGFNNRVVYSPKCQPTHKTTALYNGKQVVFKESELYNSIDWTLK